jgi:hypothetical protein
VRLLDDIGRALLRVVAHTHERGVAYDASSEVARLLRRLAALPTGYVPKEGT